MRENDKLFLKAILWILGINILINILPSPWGLIVMGGIFGHFIWQLYKDTRE